MKEWKPMMMTYIRTYLCMHVCVWLWVRVTYAYHCQFGGVANALPYNSLQCLHICTHTLYGSAHKFCINRINALCSAIFSTSVRKYPDTPKTILKWTNEKIWHLEWVLYNEGHYKQMPYAHYVIVYSLFQVIWIVYFVF